MEKIIENFESYKRKIMNSYMPLKMKKLEIINDLSSYIFKLDNVNYKVQKEILYEDSTSLIKADVYVANYIFNIEDRHLDLYEIDIERLLLLAYKYTKREELTYKLVGTFNQTELFKFMNKYASLYSIKISGTNEYAKMATTISPFNISPINKQILVGTKEYLSKFKIEV
ncbi:hypothetical protein D3C81_1057580 [compost metagenome]